MSLTLPYDTASKTVTGPSNDAGDRLRPKAPTLRELVLIVLRRHPAGLTADEIAERMGRSLLSIRPRVTELSLAGAIRDTGQRRANASGARATVWEIAR